MEGLLVSTRRFMNLLGAFRNCSAADRFAFLRRVSAGNCVVALFSDTEALPFVTNEFAFEGLGAKAALQSDRS